MTNPVTPNIGLNKIDRTSPSTTYFDLDKYIDQNADAVDQFAGAASEAIGALEKRLDTEERREVVLQPGLQIVNAERSAPFKLSGIKGRTLVNLLGRDGDFEGAALTSYKASATLDTSNFTRGSKGLKVTLSSGQTSGSGGLAKLTKLFSGRYYIGLANVKNGTASHGRVVVGGQIGTVVSDSSKFSVSYVKFNPDSDYELSVGLLVDGREGQYAYADELRLFEISSAEYAALEGITPEQVAEKYPYVASVQPVRNPYTIRYGENLLPSQIGAQFINTSSFAIAPYEWYNPTGADAVTGYSYLQFIVAPNTSYTLSTDAATNIDHALYPLDLNVPDPPKKWNTETSFTFNSGNNTSLYYLVRASIAGKPARLKNPMLTLGAEAKLFKPREDAMLALQTDLYADPVTGEHADEVFEKDGQYYKLAKWKKVVLDGVQSYTITVNRAGYKVVGITWNFPTAIKDSVIAIKHNGSQLEKLKAGDIDSASDQVILDITATVITISNTDSGWGVNYTPTVDEIKAYFMGWKMYDGGADASSTYNGTGLKAWVNLKQHKEGNSSNYTTTLPTVTAEGWTPYQIIYQLATKTVEPIVSEGMLTFIEGDNQIEVGTGIVLREGVKPVDAGDGTYWINGRTSPSYPLSKRPSRIQSVYKNNLPDNGWMVRPVDVGYENVYGLVQVRLGIGLFDPSANYSVTYLMLDKSPIAPFTGSYAANEKAMLQELTDTVQQNATAVSVLMKKEADKDSPEWITPTLLNGWKGTVRYRKDLLNNVYIMGRPESGVTAHGTVLFTFPAGFIPSDLVIFGTVGASVALHSCEITINSLGQVQVWGWSGSAALYIDLCLPPFLAEQ
ncbi:hypothetical protein P4H46_25180 [Paenibacillus glucanolyticus]|uniref:hypothetical protein n=1 Tax=Paenibacillus glucanolyticus TaxID=59843 RepID=UPI0030C99215